MECLVESSYHHWRTSNDFSLNSLIHTNLKKSDIMSIDESSASIFVRVKKIKLKCNCNGEFRNVILLPEHSFSQLKKRLSVDYGFEVFLKYQDGDGDLIILSSQNDFDDLVANVHADDTSINIIVTESSHLPTLPSRDSTKNLSVFPVSNRQFKSFENPSPSSRSNVSTPFDRFPRIESPLSAAGNFSRDRDSQHQVKTAMLSVLLIDICRYLQHVWAFMTFCEIICTTSIAVICEP